MQLGRAQVAVRDATARFLRSLLLWLSRRRFLGRIAVAMPLTRSLVGRFVAGQSLEEALPALERMHAAGYHTTVDVLGESVTNPGAATDAAERYLRTLDALAVAGLDRNVSVKLSQMGLGVDAELCRANVEQIVARAAELDGFVRIDMEDATTTDRTLALHRDVFERHANVGVVIQAALRRSADDIEDLIARGVRVRLCKGAYDEADDVAFATKAEVDASYARLMERLLLHGAYPALATHDEGLIRRAASFAKATGIDRDRFEFQMLYGVRRDLQERIRRSGWNVRVYVPYGQEWYPYFMRRMAERPANLTFAMRSMLPERRRTPRRPQ
jgi:proline dehydrogenase